MTHPLIKQLDRAIGQCIVIPNSLLPHKYHNKKTGGRSIAKLKELVKQKQLSETKAQATKRIRMTNVAQYQQQAQTGIKYNIDEDKLYRAQLNFINVLSQQGIIE